jgi:ADP-ribose pyrophosphatase
MRLIGKTEFDGPNGVVALCVSKGRFVIREIYRHATRSWELEVVRGRRESGQTARQAVRAEVKQELGFRVKRMRRIGSICPDTAIMSSTLEVYLVELADGPQRDEPESSEVFGETLWLTYPELASRIRRGEIRDSYTIAALTFARLHGHVRESRAR